MKEKRKEEYRTTHDFTDVHYWHKRFTLALRAAITGWLVAMFFFGLLLAHINHVV